MIKRTGGYLFARDEPASAATEQLERDGYVALPGVFTNHEIEQLRADMERVFDERPGDVRNEKLSETDRQDFRYEVLNHSPVCQQLLGDRRILDVIEPLLGEDFHVTVSDLSSAVNRLRVRFFAMMNSPRSAASSNESTFPRRVTTMGSLASVEALLGLGLSLRDHEAHKART